MDIPSEVFGISLYSVYDHKTPFVITLYYKDNSLLSTTLERAYSPIKTLVMCNDLSLDDVTIYYYPFQSSGLEDLYELVFDTYLNKYVGDRVLIAPFANVSKCIRDIHRDMVKKIETLTVIDEIERSIFPRGESNWVWENHHQ